MCDWKIIEILGFPINLIEKSLKFTEQQKPLKMLSNTLKHICKTILGCFLIITSTTTVNQIQNCDSNE